MKDKSCGRTSLLFPLLKSPVLSLKKKVMLYKMLILLILTYAAPGWCYIPKTVLQPLQVVQNKALRIIHSSDWYIRNLQIHNVLDMKYLHTILEVVVQKLYQSTATSSNTFISNLGQYDARKYVT